jgi:hypothetical protein
MDKKLLVAKLNSTFDIETALNLISEYCVDKRKDSKEIKTFIEMLVNFPPLISRCIETIVPYMIRKYEIYSIKNKKGKLIYYEV